MKYLLILFLALIGSPVWATTIAWDGKTLAADEQATMGHTKVFHKKFVRSETRHAVCATAGHALIGDMVKEYFMNSDEPMGHFNMPQLEDEESGVAVLIIYDDGTAILFGGDMKIDHASKIEAPFAMGTGGEIALAAMKCGKTAKEAVQLAEDNDIFTGGKIDTVEAPMPVKAEDEDDQVLDMINQLQKLKAPLPKK